MQYVANSKIGVVVILKSIFEIFPIGRSLELLVDDKLRPIIDIRGMVKLKFQVPVLCGRSVPELLLASQPQPIEKLPYLSD